MEPPVARSCRRQPAWHAPKAASETEPTCGKWEEPWDLSQDCATASNQSAKADRAQCNRCNWELLCNLQLNCHSAHSNIHSDPAQEQAGWFADVFCCGFFLSCSSVCSVLCFYEFSINYLWVRSALILFRILCRENTILHLQHNNSLFHVYKSGLNFTSLNSINPLSSLQTAKEILWNYYLGKHTHFLYSPCSLFSLVKWKCGCCLPWKYSKWCVNAANTITLHVLTWLNAQY